VFDGSDSNAVTGPRAGYERDREAGLILPDLIQEAITDRLQAWFHDWQGHYTHHRRWWPWRRSQAPLRGIYLWGDVGIGKTYLFDLTYASLPTHRKLRLHFHQFMAQVHQDLTRLQGKPNPLALIAREFSLRADVLFFDEFMVHDIADAMILGELLTALFARGICLMATSNRPPDQLYAGGLQRARFLPAIAIMKAQMEVIQLESHTDYRRRHAEERQVYYTPLDQQSRESMQRYFQRAAPTATPLPGQLHLHGRVLHTQAQGPDIIWFQFRDLCAPPRSQIDYLSLVRVYRQIMVSEVPQLVGSQEARYFMNLVDICYDAQVKLVMSAAVPIADLYPAGPFLEEFARTQSRLVAMQAGE
jgi:cell division protein ZapE